MNVFLATLGCRLNEAEILTWDRELAARGHRAVADLGAASVVVVNSCAVTSEAARKSRKLVSSLRRRNPQAPIVLTGCYASLDSNKAQRLTGADLIVDNRDKDALVERLENLDLPPGLPEANALPIARQRRTRAFIKVQDGCRNRCTFCIVTVARGDERSRTVRDVVDEIATLAASGVQEAVITGVHLGGYGSDIGTNLEKLVDAILSDTDIARLRLSSLEPWDLPENFHSLWKAEQLMPHLHLPLQSGCDATLRRMARRCPTARYRKLVNRLRANVAGLTITTDLIVGFPGETDDEWNQTKAFVEEIGFADMHIFSYSPREGTAAARFPGDVPTAVKKARSATLHELAVVMQHAAFTRFLGTRRAVLWEEHLPDADGRVVLNGYTDNYLPVSRRGDELDVRNQIESVDLASIDGRRLWADSSPTRLSVLGSDLG